IFLINVSNFFVHYWPFLLALIIIIVILIRHYLSTAEGKYAWHRYQLKLPIIGFLIQRMILLRFSETFAIIINSGIPINEGLTLVAQSLTNHYARREIISMKN